MKIIDERKSKKKHNSNNNKDRKEQGETEALVKG